MPDQEAKDMQQRYKNVFGTAEGRIVLGDILTLGHFGEILDPADSRFVARVGERNVVITIARLAGAFNGIYKDLGMTKEK